ncbi:hypothetical protein [Streptomyces chiangmaiensis]|uniref:Integral membrane protein n=1 Tax=Streptomyces chiangmaiensis TaxID=766497 RepID=A0ABU7FW72_9ACTN|nr:hypothetical protein [Streptomyces chiangmaiensis]MED7827763.1 hypothetical protein [Streptomyces chiangmaiensis]
MTGLGVEAGAQAARSRALAVLRIRSRALAVALLPAAVAVVLLVGRSTGHISGGQWGVVARWAATGVAAVVLLAAGGIALVVARARPAVSPTVPITEDSAPDLYRMVRDLADRLDVPAPSAIALTPDCDSWLEDRTHPAHGPPLRSGDEISGPRGIRGLPSSRHHRAPAAPVLVIGSPFLWWMRVGELRAVLAPVVAGTGPSAHPDIAAARRFVRGLDAAVAVTSTPTHRPLIRAVLGGVGWVARLLLRSCRGHAEEMERGVAAAAAERAQAVDYGLRIVAQEQVGLAYAGWDRLLTRVALPAWRMGRWPSRLDAGVVAALTELSRRDRLAEGFASRLGERPACDLLEEPGAVDEAASLLAARLFHGGPVAPGPDWAPVDWQEYPDEVVDRKWRADAARLHRVLDALGVHRTTRTTVPDAGGPTLERVLEYLAVRTGDREGDVPTAGSGCAGVPTPYPDSAPGRAAHGQGAEGASDGVSAPGGATVPDAGADFRGMSVRGESVGVPGGHTSTGAVSAAGSLSGSEEDGAVAGARTAAVIAGLSAEVAWEESAVAATPGRAAGHPPAPDRTVWDDALLPLFPLQPPRTGRELLVDHVAAMVCCAAMDTAGAVPGLDWLDGPSLVVRGERATDLAPRVLTLVEEGDPGPLRTWLLHLGIRPEKPVRLV